MSPKDLAACLADVARAEAVHEAAKAESARTAKAADEARNALARFVPPETHGKDVLAGNDGQIEVVAGDEILTISAHCHREKSSQPFKRTVYIRRRKLDGVVSVNELRHP